MQRSKAPRGVFIAYPFGLDFLPCLHIVLPMDSLTGPLVACGFLGGLLHQTLSLHHTGNATDSLNGRGCRLRKSEARALTCRNVCGYQDCGLLDGLCENGCVPNRSAYKNANVLLQPSVTVQKHGLTVTHSVLFQFEFSIGHGSLESKLEQASQQVLLSYQRCCHVDRQNLGHEH